MKNYSNGEKMFQGPFGMYGWQQRSCKYVSFWPRTTFNADNGWVLKRQKAEELASGCTFEVQLWFSLGPILILSPLNISLES